MEMEKERNPENYHHPLEREIIRTLQAVYHLDARMERIELALLEVAKKWRMLENDGK